MSAVGSASPLWWASEAIFEASQGLGVPTTADKPAMPPTAPGLAPSSSPKAPPQTPLVGFAKGMPRGVASKTFREAR